MQAGLKSHSVTARSPLHLELQHVNVRKPLQTAATKTSCQNTGEGSSERSISKTLNWQAY
ncbi:hypothetical protein EK904_006753 [Melospiza melodia maxima]|nr:hypothetical protein EK904_006753 [Melospiza melodia maxima]